MIFTFLHLYTVKPLNSGHLRVLKNLSIIKRCPLLGGSLTKIVTIRTKNFSAIQGMAAIWDIRYWGVSQYNFRGNVF